MDIRVDGTGFGQEVLVPPGDVQGGENPNVPDLAEAFRKISLQEYGPSSMERPTRNRAKDRLKWIVLSDDRTRFKEGRGKTKAEVKKIFRNLEATVQN